MDLKGWTNRAQGLITGVTLAAAAASTWLVPAPLWPQWITHQDNQEARLERALNPEAQLPRHVYPTVVDTRKCHDDALKVQKLENELASSRASEAKFKAKKEAIEDKEAQCKAALKAAFTSTGKAPAP